MADIPSIVSNSRLITLNSGATLQVPKVALATSWAVLSITGAVAGSSYTITSAGQAVKITIGSDGKAKMSLTPFMMQAVADAMDCPLPTDSSETTMENQWRGVLTLTIATGSYSNSVDVPFIYGGANPSYQVLERFIDYTPNLLGTWVTLDLAVWYNNDGTINSTYLNDWKNCNFNLNRYLSPAPTGDTTEQFEVALFNRGRIVFSPMDLNLHYDCRAGDVMMVKWLDAEGGINTRQFTFAKQTEGGATASTYNRHHWTKEKQLVGDGYWCGLDKWAQRTATKQITLGDDGIPQDQFSWIVSLVQSSCVEVFAETSKGVELWQRCNLVDSNIERDPRKDVFSVTLTLELAPIYEPQQF